MLYILYFSLQCMVCYSCLTSWWSFPFSHPTSSGQDASRSLVWQRNRCRRRPSKCNPRDDAKKMRKEWNQIKKNRVGNTRPFYEDMMTHKWTDWYRKEWWVTLEFSRENERDRQTKPIWPDKYIETHSLYFCDTKNISNHGFFFIYYVSLETPTHMTHKKQFRLLYVISFLLYFERHPLQPIQVYNNWTKPELVAHLDVLHHHSRVNEVDKRETAWERKSWKIYHKNFARDFVMLLSCLKRDSMTASFSDSRPLHQTLSSIITWICVVLVCVSFTLK